MPWLAQLIAGVLLTIAGNVVYRVLAALGMGAVSYFGISALMTQVGVAIDSAVGGLSGEAMQIFGMVGAGRAINIILSAWTIRVTLSGLKSDGSFSRLIYKGKQ